MSSVEIQRMFGRESDCAAASEALNSPGAGDKKQATGAK